MALTRTRWSLGILSALSLIFVLPQQALAAKQPPSPGPTLGSYTVSVGPPKSTLVSDPCTSFHGYPECGQVSITFSLTGFAKYLGLNSMESLGLVTGIDARGVLASGWGVVSGSAHVSGTVVCVTTDKAYRFAEEIPLWYFWSVNFETILSPSTRVDNDTARFTLLGGWDPRGAIPPGACPLNPASVDVTYNNAQVSSIALNFSSWMAQIPSTNYVIRGTFRIQ